MDMKEQEVYDDEISLTDLFKVIIKRRKTLYVVFFTISVLSVVFALISKPKYEYTAVIEIGTVIKQTSTGSTITPIDAPETVAAKLQHSYIPYVLDQHYKNNPIDTRGYKFSVSVPKKSELVKIVAKGGEEFTDNYLQLLGQILQQLKNDHERLFEVSRSKMEEQVVISQLDLVGMKNPKNKDLLKKGFEQQIKAIEIELTAIADQIKLEKNKKSRFLKTKSLLEKQLKDLSKGINVSVANRSKAKIKIESSSDAMTLLLIDNEIQQYRNQMIALENRVYVDIANKIEESENKVLDLLRKTEFQSKNLTNKKIEMQEQLENHDRSILKKEAHVKQVEIRLNNSKQTNALVNPMKSIGPVGVSKKLIISLGVFVGFFIALISSLIHEFVSNVRKELKENK